MSSKNKLRVGLIGAGFIGKQHSGILHGFDDVAVTAVLEKDAEKARFIHELTGCAMYSEVEDFFNNNSFDIVDICAPTWLHEELAIKALDHGCHVFCEKPLALSVKSAEAIQKKAASGANHFMVGQVLRFWPQYVKIRELVISGALGNIESVYAYRINQSPKWADWFLNPELGGGALFDLHIHDIDYLFSLFGKPDEVFARGNRGKFGAWDSVTATLGWGTTRAVVEADWIYPDGFPFQFGLRIRGDACAVQYQFAVSGNVEAKQSAEESLILISPDRVENIDCSDMGEAYTAELEYFLSCVRENRPVEHASIGDAVEVLKIVEREHKSLEDRDKN